MSPDSWRKVGIRRLFDQWVGGVYCWCKQPVIVCFRGGLCWPKTRALLFQQRIEKNCHFLLLLRRACGVDRVAVLVLRQCLHRVIIFGCHMEVIVFIYHPLTEMFIYHPRLILFTALTPHQSPILIMISCKKEFSGKSKPNQNLHLIEITKILSFLKKYQGQIPTLGLKVLGRVICVQWHNFMNMTTAPPTYLSIL